MGVGVGVDSWSVNKSRFSNFEGIRRGGDKEEEEKGREKEGKSGKEERGMGRGEGVGFGGDFFYLLYPAGRAYYWRLTRKFINFATGGSIP